MAIIRNSTTGNDVRIGPAFEANQFIDFGIGSDTLTGGALSDVFVMGVDGLTDAINGGTGIDRVDYSGSTRGLTISLGGDGKGSSVTASFLTGFQPGPSGSILPVYETKTVATLTNIEDVTGSGFGDSITGSNLANRLDGGGGDDALFGFAGADTLIGGTGNDTLDGGSDNDLLIGGAGMDNIIGGSGTDTVSYADASIGMNIRLDAPLFSSPDSPILAGAARQITSTGLVNEDTLSGIENVTGSAFNDVIKSNGALNTIEGGAGDDVLQSWVDGLRDVMNGGTGNDTIDYSAFAQANGLIVNLGANGTDGSAFHGFTSAGGVTTITFEDTLISIENAIGTSQADIIIGNELANILNGGGGNDVIIGGGGADILSGGSGADTFRFSGLSDFVAPNQADRILDFERGLDQIDLSAIDANVNLAGDQSFVIVDQFTGTAGEIMAIPEWRGSGQAWLMDVNGDSLADAQILLHMTDGLGTFLTGNDFLL